MMILFIIHIYIYHVVSDVIPVLAQNDQIIRAN